MASRHCSNNYLNLSFAGLLLIFQNAHPESLIVNVSNQSGNPVENAVVSAYPQTARVQKQGASVSVVKVDQVDKEFIEHVTPIQVGTAVSFPNHDNFRHHVYSFSPAKTFEIPLYEGIPANPVIFEKTGEVALGCNIHDWMSAYVYVVDTPYFARTGVNGQASLDLRAGSYEIRIWHPQLQKEPTRVYQKVEQELPADIQAELVLKPALKPRRGPVSLLSRGRYR